MVKFCDEKSALKESILQNDAWNVKGLPIFVMNFLFTFNAFYW